MNNLASLILNAAKVNPAASFGTVERAEPLSTAVHRAACLAGHLASLGHARGSRLALVGANSADYMATWLAAQLAGIELALLNPEYPDELLLSMFDDLRPNAVAWLDRPAAAVELPQIDLRAWWNQHRGEQPEPPAIDMAQVQGVHCVASDISSFIHTSGTTGKPKFCALSHDYFLRLGRFFADSLCLTRQDRLFAPLPMFHINPLGYGLVGGLTAKASVLGTDRFSASQFWPLVKQHRFSALVLHAAPAIILATSTTSTDARGHEVRIAFGAESTISALFDLPICVGGYGSTEAGGLCHSWHFRAGDPPMAKEGISNFTGRPRYDVDFKVDENEEILVRSKAGQAILSGYMRGGKLCDALDDQGWFHTGDRGRIDETTGCLVFIERANESIRCKGEYVPIEFVEAHLSKCPSLGGFALWRQPSAITGHEVVIYTQSAEVNLDEVRSVVSALPRFMQAQRIIRVKELPRTGIGKVQRSRLDGLPEIDSLPLWEAAS
jgi:acyl-CoA synthetase (AMP-forming)/AMP-acid ligase II